MSIDEDKSSDYVSRGGLKLAWALDSFGFDPAGLICVDMGANVGGFTDCLLQRGALKVYAVDTGYGVLDYRLRKDQRVVVKERTNALHVTLGELCDLAVIDLAWTPQRLSLPKAVKLVKPDGHIISLVKPQYEAPKEWIDKQSGTLMPEQSQRVFDEVRDQIGDWGLTVTDFCESRIVGKGGNREYLLLCQPRA